jgi:hypothetical protein
MRTVNVLFAVILAGLLLVQSGCQRLNVEKTITLIPGDTQAVLVDGPARDQQVEVTISSPGVPISAYLVYEKDREKVGQGLGVAVKTSPEILDRVEKKEDITLTYKIAAKQNFAVVMTEANKKTEVKVKIVGR